ncbi:Ras guanine nucleotide exchange factor [Tieghemostelium lacteum]|uniref:Ras guanine nucleotide exchange factor n=1 Tax=Tieghemostelium lacteum TaxID=361077 RepID=A0A151ZSI9_TIELA|nr:Ras guanine nucleotide exchange factor [Tieghemostelium lacteum]|eukprot:KYQ96865.1 Ras guanine nucleotide exchange factor [Tieghemostelium lacteum]
MIESNHNDTIQNLYSKNKVDRSEWRRNVLKANPEINNLCDRIYPINRTIQFSKQFHPGKLQVKQKLDKQAVIQLILQHLSIKGLKQTKATLEKESKIQTPVTEGLGESRLVDYIRQAMRDIDKVYDLTMEHTEFTPEEKSSKLLERDEMFSYLDLLEEEDQDDGVNIWDEPVENIHIEKVKTDDIEEEVVKSASLNKLVEKLTHDSKMDLQFVKTFLMTYQSFCTPEKLLTKLIQRYNVPKNYKIPGGAAANTEEAREAFTKMVQIRVINVIKKWVDEYFSDFDEKLIQTLKSFIETFQSKYTALATGVLKSLNKNEKPVDTYKQILNDKTPEPVVPKNIFSNYLNIFDIDEEEIARQLTLIEFDIFRKIKPPELLNQSWNKPKLKARAPNVLKMIDRFNSVSMWVATLIVQTVKVRVRGRLMTKFMKIAEHLKNMNNFNSLMAIIAGLNFSSVYRLKHTRDEVSAQVQKSFQELEKIMNSEGNFKIYRTKMLQAAPPCLPYLGTHLTDLTFMEENPDYIPVDVLPTKRVELINFTKRTLVFKVISLLQQLQQQPYNLQPVHQIQEFLLNVRSDFKGQSLEIYQQELYKESLKREPKRAQRSDIQ